VTETVASEIDIDASPDDVLAVLTDFESYPRWARSMKQASVIESGPDGRASKVEFHVAPGLLPNMRYVLAYTYGDGSISWSYVEGDLKDIRGSYTVEGTDGTSHVTYNLAIDPGKIPLPGFVKARAAREITRIALKELKRRVEGAR
jgi:hypothetical protein